MKLTIEHLAAYLPYEVNMTRNGFVGKLLTIKLPKETDIYDGIEYQVSCSNWWENTTDANHYKPLLRPLSDLTKEIEHNGERFVPIERLFANYGETFIANYTDGSQITLTATYKLMGETYTDFIVCRDSFEFVRYEYVTKLLSWHFDCFGLIESELAIPIKPIDNEQQRN